MPTNVLPWRRGSVEAPPEGMSTRQARTTNNPAHTLTCRATASHVTGDGHGGRLCPLNCRKETSASFCVVSLWWCRW